MPVLVSRKLLKVFPEVTWNVDENELFDQERCHSKSITICEDADAVYNV